MTSKIEEIRRELNQLYSHRDTFLLYHKECPSFLRKTIKSLELKLRQKIEEDLLPQFPSTIDSYSDDNLTIELEYNKGEIKEIRVLNHTFSSCFSEDKVLDEETTSAEDINSVVDSNIIPTHGEIIRFICRNTDKPEINILAEKLNLTSNRNKAARQAAYKEIIKLHPYYIGINMEDGPKRVLPAKMVSVGNDLYKPTICKTVEEVVELILKNSTGKNIRVFSNNMYDKNDNIVS